MSSAILYVAIVGIWACVLIPRWLKRESSVSASSGTDEPAAKSESAGQNEELVGQCEESAAQSEELAAKTEEPGSRSEEPASKSQEPGGGVAVTALSAGPAVAAGAVGDEQPRSARRRRADGKKGRPAPDQARARGLMPDQSRNVPRDAAHRRMLRARRGLLAMLIVLTIASGALAALRLAAWWVIIPPSALLLCYLPLLRAAAKADTERRKLARTQSARVALTGAAGAPAAAVRAAAHRASSAHGVAGARPGGTPGAQVIHIPASRDAGSHGGRAGQDLYDQDAEAPLRAVGD